MQFVNDITFGRFRLDLRNECLWDGTRAIALRPKAFAVLRLLVEHAGLLVTKQQVLDTVWPGTFVGDAVLKDIIRQLREALGDDAASPTYIETAHRRGYRFIVKVAMQGVPEIGAGPAPPTAPRVTACSSSATVQVLGRDAELATMRDRLDRALGGERQLLFVTGEPGIGKTTVVEAFVEQAAQVPGVLVVRGHCLEHYGSGEAYLPVLDGFSRLCRSVRGSEILNVLRQHAPSWLAQMPSLVPVSERIALQSQTAGTTRERMLREMAEAIEELTSECPLLLVLEDLHWSDYSTLDLVSYLARRRDVARLVVIGTYRPVDVILSDHPLKGVKRELQAHGLCTEIALEYLNEGVVAEYLRARFPRHELPARLRRAIYHRTEGNPLFVVNLVEYLTERNVIAEDDGRWKLRVDPSNVEQHVPSSLRELIERQLDRLSPEERTVLEAASVAGIECCSVALAAGLDMPVEWVEKHCEELARRHQFFSAPWLAELPDGTLSPRYRFNHILYLEVPYGLIPPKRRAEIHRRIADRGVEIYGARAGEIAAELAMHFEQSRDWPHAVHYLIQAAETAMQKTAHYEAAVLARRGLEALNYLAGCADRSALEIKLRIILGVSLMAIKGFASAEVEEVFARGRELFWVNGPSPELFHMLWSLNLYYQFGGDVHSSLSVTALLLELAQDLKDTALTMEAHRARGAALVILGRCKEGLEHLDEAAALYVTCRRHCYSHLVGLDCKVICDCFAGRALWALGDPDAAVDRTAAALDFARELGDPHTLVVACQFAAQLHQLRGEASLVYERSKEAVELADEYGMELWLAYGLIGLGWAEAELGSVEEGIEKMQHGLAAYEATGAQLWSSYSLELLADQLAKAGQLEAAIAAINKALTYAEHSGEKFSLSELHRLKGELLMKAFKRESVASRPKVTTESCVGADCMLSRAQRCFENALDIAQQQEARSWEVKARASIERLARVN